MLDINDICYLYRTARDRDEEVFILADLTASDADTIIEVLKDAGEYEENHIQRCIKCKELYIEMGRKLICPVCKDKEVRKRRYARKKKVQ